MVNILKENSWCKEAIANYLLHRHLFGESERKWIDREISKRRDEMDFEDHMVRIDERPEKTGINFEQLFYSLAQRHTAIMFHLRADNIEQALKVCETANEIIGNVFMKTESEHRRQPCLLDPEKIKKEWVDIMKQRCGGESNYKKPDILPDILTRWNNRHCLKDNEPEKD